MKPLLTLLLLALYCPVFASYDQHFTANTLRFDYFRTGNHNTELVSFDVLMEEGPWAGSQVNLIDTLDLGTHKFEVNLFSTGQLIYSRGYCSLFNEWQTTDEARNTWRTFGETILLPYPKDSVRVVFYTRNRKNEWMHKFEYIIDPSSPYISREKKTSYPVYDIHISAFPTEALDIVFLPDGYTADELEKFRNDCVRFAGYLLNSAPFSQYKENISIRAVLAPSLESGPDMPGVNIWKQNILNSNFYTFGSERYLTTMDIKSVRNIASNVPYDQIAIIVNTPKYGGGGIYNYYSVTGSDHPQSDYVFIHEFGHALAGLGDEYYNSEVAYEDYYDLGVEPWEPNLTTLVRFQEKWNDMVSADTPIPTPAQEKNINTIGAYEGGGYTAKGVYRPYMDCTMKSLKYNSFCPVCQRSIENIIRFHLH